MAQQQQPQNNDNSMAPVWIMVLLIVTVFFIWKSAHGYIVAGVFYLNVLQAKVVSLFVDSADLQNNVYLMQTIDPNTVDWDQFLILTRSVGDYIRYPVVIILALLAIFLY
ncbi:MAG: phosphoesterase, partial [Proteobacteria bacterium]|nr:phosphoesterase [Pseudomonadota bacterium]